MHQRNVGQAFAEDLIAFTVGKVPFPQLNLTKEATVYGSRDRSSIKKTESIDSATMGRMSVLLSVAAKVGSIDVVRDAVMKFISGG